MPAAARPYVLGVAQTTHEPRMVAFDDPLDLALGGRLEKVRAAYETHGTLRHDGRGNSNAVLICHALSGDSHVARRGEGDSPGWWDLLVGPGRFVDTDRHFVVCSNTLGGCRGTTGPGDLDPATGRPYGGEFPEITMADCVEVQRRLIDHLGVGRLAGVVGGSMGGQQALTWALAHGDRLQSCVLVATSPRLTAQALAFDVVGRNAILRDPHFHGGQYYDAATKPDVGLALARMLGHITYLGREGMTAKFDPVRDKPRDVGGPFELAYGVGSYLAHQGQKFADRFDANSYVTLTRAMDRFDLGQTCDDLAACFKEKTAADCRFGVLSFSSDWLFPPEQSRQIVEGLGRAGRRTSYLEVTSEGGHDAFLLPDEAEQYGRFIEAVLGDGGLRAVAPQLPASEAPTQCGTVAAGLRPAVENRTSIFAEGRLDHDAILNLIPNGASVLDLGCGDGGLLAKLRDRGGHGRLAGVEVVTEDVLRAVGRGLDVIDADLNRPLRYFADGQFDVVVLSQTLQSVENTVGVIGEVLRVGRRGVVSFPNFAYRPLREMLSREGRSPKSAGPFAYEWYDSPNRRYPSIADFLDLCRVLGLRVERATYLDTQAGRPVSEAADPNLNADLAVVVLSAAAATR